MRNLEKTKHVWWAKPAIRTDEDEDIERKATWLELFYDLAFVGVLAQLSNFLYREPSWEHAAVFTFLLIPAWWIWNSTTYYNERYERNDVRHRVLTFVSMLPVAGIAYAIYNGLPQAANIYAVSYILSRILIIYMWISVGNTATEKKLSRQFAFGFLISVMLWTISLFIPGSFKYVLWGMGLLVDMITPMFTLDTQLKLPKISTHHIPERFGLFTTLAIGETVIGAINGFASNRQFDFWIAIAGIMGLVVSLLVWWLYIDHVLYRIFKKNIWAILAWSYLHLPLAMGITALGAGVLALLSGFNKELVADPVRWLLCVSLAFTIFIIALFGFVSERGGHHDKAIRFHRTQQLSLFGFKLLSIVLILLVGFFGLGLHPVALLGLLLAIMFIPILNGISIWVKSHLEMQLST